MGALTTLKITNLKEDGLYGDGGGLYLQVKKQSKTWIFRYTAPLTKKRRDMGLGAFPLVPLLEARDKATDLQRMLKAGVDPLDAKEAERQAKIAEEKRAATEGITFDECAAAYIEAKQHEWKNAKHAAQWGSTLAMYASPVIGSLPVKDVTKAHVLEILTPIWLDKNETASRLRGRIENVIDWAIVKEYRNGGVNPAFWKGYLDKLLSAPAKVQKVKHHAALPYKEIASFMAALHQKEGMAARALAFSILTATRSGEVRGAQWQEFDLDEKTWTIPASRMKAGKEHRVPLSGNALALLERLPRLDGTDTVFFSPTGKVLSDMTLTAVLRRMNRSDLTVHGFRSTFRDWAGEVSAFPREVIEHALAHQLKDKAEAAYFRGDVFDKRIQLMTAWASYCDHIPTIAKVIPLKRKNK